MRNDFYQAVFNVGQLLMISAARTLLSSVNLLGELSQRAFAFDNVFL